MKKKLLKLSIVGKTNAGKSTLINNLIGETVSIINKKVNTTEDLIIGVKNYNKSQLVYFDTPGLNNLKKIDNKKIKLKKNLWNGLNESDLIIYLIDINKYKFNEISQNLNKLNELSKDIIIVFNKNDLVEKKIILPKIKEINKNSKISSFFSISAKKKLGLKNLEKYLLKKAYISEWLYRNNEISNKDDIFITNEITRNSVLDLIHKEVPYNITIVNKIFRYLKNGDIKIKQDIEIKNLRYKKIILGKNGTKIKLIRERSQKNISKILKTKTHLYINITKSYATKL